MSEETQTQNSEFTANDAIDKWIWQEFGKKSDLLQDEYKVIINPTQAFDIGWHAGAMVLISIRFTPFELDLFKAALRRAFSNPYLKQFRRSKAMVRRADALSFYTSTFSGLHERADLARRSKAVFTVEYVMSVKVKDRKTKAEQSVEIVNCDAFTAQNKALRMLYGGEEE